MDILQKQYEEFLVLISKKGHNCAIKQYIDLLSFNFIHFQFLKVKFSCGNILVSPSSLQLSVWQFRHIGAIPMGQKQA